LIDEVVLTAGFIFVIMGATDHRASAKSLLPSAFQGVLTVELLALALQFGGPASLTWRRSGQGAASAQHR
jgi:glycerol uptake facilitator-like aquaporin